jgi:hypothetical protein
MNMQLRDMGARELLKAAINGLLSSQWTRQPCHTVGDSGAILARAKDELRGRGISLAAQVLVIEMTRVPVISLAYHRGLDHAMGAMCTGRGCLGGQHYEFWEIELTCARLCWRRPVAQGGVS